MFRHVTHAQTGRMSEEEKTATTTTTAPAAEATTKPVSSGKRIQRPTKPDRSELDKQITTLKDQISKCHDKMGELKSTIDAIKEGRRGQGSATQEPRNKLIALRTELKGLYEEQNGIRMQLKVLDAQKDQIRAQQKALREKCQYVK